MFPFLKRFSARIGSLRRRLSGIKPLFDSEDFEAMLERSRVPAVLMLVLVWTVSTVVLMLSGVREYRLLNWEYGQRAPHSIFAKDDFRYESSAETERQRTAARNAVPAYYRTDGKKTKEILDRADAFFKWVADPAPKPEAAPISKPSPELKQALAKALGSTAEQRKFKENLQNMLKRGIIGSDAGANWRVADRDARSALRRSDTVDQCAGMLARQVLWDGAEPPRTELRKILKELIGKDGNLKYDAALTDAERKKAEKAVKPVMKDKERGSLLIRKGERYTEEIAEMLKAERRLTPGALREVAFRQTMWSFFILLAGVLFIFWFSRDVFRDNVRIMLAGITIAAALTLNYLSIRLFEILLQNLDSLDNRLLVSAVPIAFCAVVLSVVLDLRTALCAGGIVAAITSLMTPYHSLELALSWTAISAVATLAVHHVSNDRPFFERTALVVAGTTLLLSIWTFFRESPEAELPLVVKHAAFTIIANAAACAMLSLFMIFVLERVFNLSTDMVLVEMSNSNHEVLERMKREAPGTMAHSEAVATLAEDAARTIGANPLRAKVGALFHDIGKLSKPQYFTENNPDSSLLHDRLTPEKSARIILAHVTDGVAMAREHRFCRFIRNVISSHHGDDLVRFFYNRALEQAKKTGATVKEEDFRYNGRPPRSREEGIISLADACEAASRSLKEPTPENIDALVGNIIQGRFRDGMLRDSHLTAAELDTLRKSFASTLSSMMHSRIAYPAGANAPGKDKKC